MKKMISLVSTCLVLSTFTTAHAAIVSAEEVAVCPKAIELNSQAIMENVAYYIQQKDLYTAANLASTCASFGSGLDVNIISPVVEALENQISESIRTEKDKVSKNKKLTSKQIAEQIAVLDAAVNDLDAKAGLCHKRYAKENSGSMGRAFAASCELKVYQAFDSLYGPRDEEDDSL